MSNRSDHQRDFDRGSDRVSPDRPFPDQPIPEPQSPNHQWPDYKSDASIPLRVERLLSEAASLLLYASVLDHPVGDAFLDLLHQLHAQEADRLACQRAYGRWFRALATDGCSWRDYLIRQILLAENPFTQQAQGDRLDALPESLVAAARHDLRGLQALSRCDSRQVSQWVQVVAATPTAPVSWEMSEQTAAIALEHEGIEHAFHHSDDWGALLADLAAYHHRHGVGLFAQYRALRWQGELVGIAHPDPVQLNDLAAYDIPRQALIQNTEALLAGYRALHVLLYGSRGSGKSSLVKALLNAYGDRGLRLIEVTKSDLRDLPSIVERLRDRPQTFIIFVDDLSFEDDDDAFKALKVVLEGSVTARPQNVVVYATSNRRHLIREFHDDRPRPRDADELHPWDTVQEKLSFSDRFGLTLTFEPADQTTYLAIAHHLAQREGLTLPPDELDYRALQWATRHNGRSGRTARQFIDALVAEVASIPHTP